MSVSVIVMGEAGRGSRPSAVAASSTTMPSWSRRELFGEGEDLVQTDRSVCN